MLCAKLRYDRHMIVNKCLGFYDLTSNESYSFFINSSIKLNFSLRACEFKAIFIFTKSIHATFLSFSHANV